MTLVTVATPATCFGYRASVKRRSHQRARGIGRGAGDKWTSLHRPILLAGSRWRLSRQNIRSTPFLQATAFPSNRIRHLYNTIQYILNWPLSMGAFQGQWNTMKLPNSTRSHFYNSQLVTLFIEGSQSQVRRSAVYFTSAGWPVIYVHPHHIRSVAWLCK